MKDGKGVPSRTLPRGAIFAVVTAAVACVVLFGAWLSASRADSPVTGEAITDGDYYWGDGDRQAQLSLYRDGLMDPDDPETAWVGVAEGTDWTYSFFFTWDDDALSYDVRDDRRDDAETYSLRFAPIDDESFRLTVTNPGDGRAVVFDGVLTEGDPYPD